MALTAPAITAAILVAAPELKGSNWFQLATAIGSAIAAWSVIPANLALTGVTTGVAGVGVVNGKLLVVPAPLPVPAAAAASGLVGLVSPTVARAVGVGIAVSFNASAQYQGVSPGVGTGSDISKVTVANASTLILTLQGVLNGSGLVGGDVPRLSTALGTGIATLLFTGTGVGAVTGPAGPVPAAGTSLSRVF